jgi:hypothetical protein
MKDIPELIPVLKDLLCKTENFSLIYGMKNQVTNIQNIIGIVSDMIFRKWCS